MKERAIGVGGRLLLPCMALAAVGAGCGARTLEWHGAAGAAAAMQNARKVAVLSEITHTGIGPFRSGTIDPALAEILKRGYQATLLQVTRGSDKGGGKSKGATSRPASQPRPVRAPAPQVSGQAVAAPFCIDATGPPVQSPPAPRRGSARPAADRVLPTDAAKRVC